MFKTTSALVGALALSVASADPSTTTTEINFPHVPLVLWSQQATLHGRDTYVDAVLNEVTTADVLQAVLSRGARKDDYSVVSSTASTEPTPEVLCVFVRENLKSSQLAELGPDSFVRSAVKTSTSSVVVAHTTRTQSLTQALVGVDHPVVPIDEVAAWIKSAEGDKLLSNKQTDLLVVTILEEGLELNDVDAKIKLAAEALVGPSKERVIDFALTGDGVSPIVVKNSSARRGRRLATGQAVTAESIICDTGYLIGLSSTGKAYCFSHYVHMTPEILTALIFGFFFLFLAYVGLTALHAIQTPLRYPLHGPPKGKEF